MQHGPGPGNKKPLIIGGAIIGAIWLLNSTYRDGFMDGLLASGKGEHMHYMGGGFPWGLLIIGGILYFFWKKGSFDRHNGRGPFGPGGYGPPATMQQQGPDPRAFMSPEQRAQWDQQQAQWAQRYGQGQQFRGPRGFFDDWHRQAHEGFNHQPQAGTMTPPPPFTPPAGGPSTPPPPPAADYWTNVNRPAEASTAPQGPTGSADTSGSTAGATSAAGQAGSQPEQW